MNSVALDDRPNCGFQWRCCFSGAAAVRARGVGERRVRGAVRAGGGRRRAVAAVAAHAARRRLQHAAGARLGGRRRLLPSLGDSFPNPAINSTMYSLPLRLHRG